MKKTILCSAILLTLYACKDRTAAVAMPPKQVVKSTTSPTTTEPVNEPAVTEPVTSASWGEIEKDAFVRECTKAAMSMGENKAKDYCNCMLGKMQAKFPDINDADKMTQEETMSLAKECLK